MRGRAVGVAAPADIITDVVGSFRVEPVREIPEVVEEEHNVVVAQQQPVVRRPEGGVGEAGGGELAAGTRVLPWP